MPILNVEIVGSLPPETADGLAGRLADAAAGVFDSPPHGTWVKLRYIPSEQYAENGGGPSPGTAPVFVSLLLADPPKDEARREKASALTAAIAEVCGREPDEVHVLYEMPARGRISFGGQLRN